MPEQIIIRKSKSLNFLTFLFGLTGLYLLFYVGLTKDYFFSFISLIFIIGFSYFSYLSFRELLNSAPQIIINKSSISFRNDEIIQWIHITDTFIEYRINGIYRRNEIEGYYLTIKTIFSGVTSKKESLFSFKITGLEMNPTEISHFVELYKMHSQKNMI